MLKYQKLPKNTKPSTVAGVLFIGACLGYGIAVHGFIALYGLGGFLNNYFFPANNLPLADNEAAYLGLMGLAAAVCAVWLSFAAFDMNILSKKARLVAQSVGVPIIIVIGLVYYQIHAPAFKNHLSASWLTAAWLTFPLCGLLPAIFLNTKAARKLHNR